MSYLSHGESVRVRLTELPDLRPSDGGVPPDPREAAYVEMLRYLGDAWRGDDGSSAPLTYDGWLADMRSAWRRGL